MTGKELVKLFKKAGWRLDRIRGSHHIMKKNESTVTIPVHGNKDIPKGLLEKLLKEGGLK
jgi:predicted RNA binding protein YcfA (HicA-like mRNA interferase family)